MNIEEWNNRYGIKQPVELREDDGSITYTHTTSKAWDVCGTAVVMVGYKSGGYDLSRIKAR